ncbi:hypothetical protein ACFLXQ_05030 [Chloroflexota bacterium]
MERVEHHTKEITKDEWFKRNPRKTMAIVVGIMLLVLFIIFEICLRYFMGLGKTGNLAKG